MFIARLYLAWAIALPSDRLNEPATTDRHASSSHHRHRPTSHLLSPSLCPSLSSVPSHIQAYTESLCTLFFGLASGIASAIDTHPNNRSVRRSPVSRFSSSRPFATRPSFPSPRFSHRSSRRIGNSRSLVGGIRRRIERPCREKER